jgi:hypothetical protein
MNNKCFVPAYLFIVLLVSNCSGGSLQAHENRSASGADSTQPRQATEPAPVREPGELIDAVKRAYTDLTYYGSKGTHQVREEVRGKRIDYQEIPFEIKYTRNREADLMWKENGLDKALKIEGKCSWLEVDGRRQRTFANPGDGLEIGPKTGQGDVLFAIRYFIFRDELQLGDKFFSGLVNPESNAEEVVDGHTCNVLTGTYNNVEARNTYWIDSETGVIRRIQQTIVIRTKSEGKEYVSTTTTTENYTDIELAANPR